MYEFTWGSTEHLASVLKTMTGSGAGTPLADIMYVSAMSKVIVRLRTNLKAMDLQTEMKIDGVDTVLHEVGYIDDTALSIVAPAKLLVQKCARTAEVAYATFHAYGMELNFKAGKSECLLAWRGPLSHQARLSLEKDGCQCICSCKNMSFILRFVDKYKHLGTTLLSYGSLSLEVSCRACIIVSEVRHLSKRVLSHSQLSISRKCSIVSAYIWSKGLFQCSTWQALSPGQYKRLHTAIMKAYRAIVGHQRAWTLTDDEVISELKVMCPLTMIRAKRICLFGKVLFDPLLLALIRDLVSVKDSWAHTIMCDLAWLALIPGFRSCVNYSLDQWIGRITDVGLKAFKKGVNKACRLEYANLVTHWAATPAMESAGAMHMCKVCNKACKSFQARSVHEYLAHGIKCVERLYVDGTQCQICLKEFWSRERHLNHIRYRSPVCKENLLLRPPCHSNVEADRLDETDKELHRSLLAKGARRHTATRRCVQASGPLLPIVADPENISVHHPLGKGHRYIRPV